MDRPWLAWTLFFIVWTAVLLAPGTPDEQLPLGEFLIGRKVLIAKVVHVVGYAILAILAGRLRVPSTWRLWFLFGMMLHAALTEFIQQYQLHRSGALSDVLWNHLGIGIGCCSSWKWWTRHG